MYRIVCCPAMGNGSKKTRWQQRVYVSRSSRTSSGERAYHAGQAHRIGFQVRMYHDRQWHGGVFLEDEDMIHDLHNAEWLKQVHEFTQGRDFMARDLPEHLYKHGNSIKKLSTKTNKLHFVGWYEHKIRPSRIVRIRVWRVVL